MLLYTEMEGTIGPQVQSGLLNARSYSTIMSVNATQGDSARARKQRKGLEEVLGGTQMMRRMPFMTLGQRVGTTRTE